VTVFVTQIDSVTADNASNCIAAFQVLENPSEGEVFLDLNDEEENVDEDLEIQPDSVTDDIVAQLLPGNAIQNSCLAHLLQLAIKDAIKASPIVRDVTTRINTIVSYFNKSPSRCSQLTELTDGLKLIKPIAIRWNSLHNALHRLMRVINKDKVKRQRVRNIHEC